MSSEMTISPKQQAAIAALLDGATQQQAAKIAGVTPKTIGRWLNDAAFWMALRDAGQQGLRLASGRMLGNMSGAVDVIETIMQDATTPKGVRLRAAMGYLDAAIRLNDVADIIARIEALEERLQ